MKKKILIFSLDYYPGDVGGAEVAIKEITGRVDADAYEFHVLTLRYDTTMPKVENIDGVVVHRIGFGKKNPTISERRSFPLHYNKHLFQFTAAFKAWRLQRSYQYDGVWAMMAHSCGVPAALFTLLCPSVKFILTLQEGDPPEQIEKMARPVWPLFKRAFTRADAIQVISSFLGKWAMRMGASAEPILVPNAVNVAHFSGEVSESAISDAEAVMKKAEDDVLLITTSRLVRKNAVDDVINALPHLPEHVHFAVFGDGPDKALLEQLVEEKGLQQRVHFHGIITHAQMPAYLKASDIFIRPSRSEGMGNSFIEAMAAGLPVIATQEGGIADFLFDSVRNPEVAATGWAVDKDAPEQIAEAVQRILSDEAVTKETCATASELVHRKYSWDLIASDMETKVFNPLFSNA